VNFYLGQIMIFGGNFAMQDTGMCHGQLLAISQNQALFSLIGTFYGGDGRTTIGLPELRGRAPIGYGQRPGGSPFQIGQYGGSETRTLGVANLPPHSHTAQVSGGKLTVQNTSAGQTSPQSDSYIANPRSSDGVTTLGFTASTGSPVEINGQGAPSVTNANTGQGLPFSAMSPYQAVNFLMVLNGLYPQRA
jgi:microcystin-dependent protein